MLAVVTHHTHGPVLLGLLAAAVFFLVRALMLPVVGLPAFAAATGAAVATQAVSVLAIPRDPQPGP